MSAATAAASREGAQRALARGVVWEQLALGFQRPSPASEARLRGDSGRRMLLAAVRELDGGLEVGGLGSAAARFASRPPLCLEELQVRHDRFFGHTARGLVCAFETEYGAGGLFRQPEELAHIGGYYQAFGLRPRPDGERVDHIACECEFMGFLARKEALLLTRDGGAEPERAQLETTRDAARSFLRAHLGRFGVAFGTRLQRADPDGDLGDLADLLVAVLRADAAERGVPLGPATLDLRPPEPDATPMACGGSCEGLEPSIPVARPERRR